ncbi:hypothetical protein VTJ04DRAFT_3225 [Mycothermus thermophilus]|uniref:uncharacterized protein n=1 Tax=Humicola insolens TaxID=85995 RepID=UPI00374239DF
MATTEAGAGSSSSAPQAEQSNPASGFKLKFCTVCASNQNRSMEGHLRLAQANYPVISFGTGSLVRLPGPTQSQPNVYKFNQTSYDSIYRELEAKDPRLYQANGLLNMLGRNRSIKWGPERWQDWVIGAPRIKQLDNKDQGAAGMEAGVPDIVITCEERCWDAVVDDLMHRGAPLNRPVHVINIDIRDNHRDASIGGSAIVDLADSLNKVAVEEREKVGPAVFDAAGPGSRASFDERVPEVVGEWQERWPDLPATWTLAWF